ncbi:MAG: ubiquinol-cytochrome c reductase complex 17 kd [Lasallia pustulata]|uniref:Cytochrome b-c1 complex subunit 6, mitochondrial n=1 Tax=Lasallia pustulata TaxID=136370 RepID=A0A1W5CYI7_9LECA|nr:MAG: ubiquinol-cytochrome c reductase complex 17 kd [Lasallia pustulata]SLM35943.1 ubiquinol-cytochrome c reductase complex 17 kd protein [Lasallia pustulata]
MGFTDLFQDFVASLSFTELQAEAAPEEKDDDAEEKEEGGDEKKEGGDEEEEKGEGEEGGEETGRDEEEEEEEEEPEEEEEEAEEPEDPKPKIEEACAHSTQCAPAKHHYEECVERVTAQHSDPKHKGPKEDCVEEFFHLQHCATQCAAPKLFRQLK